jgi:subtilase family serine protease
VSRTVNVVPAASNADLTVTGLTMNPAAPARAPGASFSVTATVQNAGTAPSGSSTVRYYLSLDAGKSADDTRLTGSQAVGGLDPGESRSGAVTVTIPASTPLNTYFLLACADDANVVGEPNEDNNCVATPGATVTVGRPNLSATAVAMNPPAPARDHILGDGHRP